MVVQESLAQIEAILKAESKRRQEANQITEEYILNYLESLEQNLNQRVQGQFQTLENRIATADAVLRKVEQQFDTQDREVTQIIEDKTVEAEKQLADSDLLMRNVKGAFQVQHDNIGKSEDKIIREIQLLLLNDKTQWQ